jgi:hypothetical protein
MPFGISESAISKAYGPLDLSGVYKSIDAVQKKADAEEKQLKLYQQKEYYSSLASLNKDINGIRGEDNNDVMEDYNKWKNIQQKMLANPMLMQRDPETYGKLNAEAEGYYGSAMAKANASKIKKDYLQKLGSQISTNPKKFKKGSAELFSDVAKKTTKELQEMGVDGLDNFVYDGPDFEKVGKDFDEIRKVPKTLGRVDTYSDDKLNYSVFAEHEIPDVNALQTKIGNVISKYDPQDLESIFKRIEPQYDAVRKAYEDIPNDVFDKYKTSDGKADRFSLHDSPVGQTKKPYINFDATTDAGKLNAYLLASNMVNIQNSVPAKGKSSQTDYGGKGEVGKKEIMQKVGLPLQEKLLWIKQKYALQRQQKGYLDKRDLVQLDKETGAQMNLIFDLIKSKRKIDISEGTEITDDVVDNVLDELSGVIGKVRPKSTETKGGKKGSLY